MLLYCYVSMLFINILVDALGVKDFGRIKTESGADNVIAGHKIPSF